MRLPRKTDDQPAPPPLHPEEVPGDSWLYRLALQVERDERLMAELAEWEAAAIADGLDDTNAPENPVTSASEAALPPRMARQSPD